MTKLNNDELKLAFKIASEYCEGYATSFSDPGLVSRALLQLVDEIERLKWKLKAEVAYLAELEAQVKVAEILEGK